MVIAVTGPVSRSALVIVDMQNDIVHPDGRFAHRAARRSRARMGHAIRPGHNTLRKAPRRCLS
jgi:nicotinamidase-related amidase